jgi:hypothetical protein
MPLVREADTEWGEKKNALVWRGSTTGPMKDDPDRNFQSRLWIADLAERTGGSEHIDVGFSFMQGIAVKNGLVDGLQRYVRPKMTMAEQLQNKYLLSIEGNDVATGLKWMLLSESVVLMPKPSVESWFCESKLEPYVHYVPVAGDLSDVEQQVNWCINNDSDAREIAMNGTRFASSFLGLEQETEVFTRVVRWYAENEVVRDLVEVFAQARTAAV